MSQERNNNNNTIAMAMGLKQCMGLKQSYSSPVGTPEPNTNTNTNTTNEFTLMTINSKDNINNNNSNRDGDDGFPWHFLKKLDLDLHGTSWYKIHEQPRDRLLATTKMRLIDSFVPHGNQGKILPPVSLGVGDTTRSLDEYREMEKILSMLAKLCNNIQSLKLGCKNDVLSNTSVLLNVNFNKLDHIDTDSGDIISYLEHLEAKNVTIVPSPDNHIWFDYKSTFCLKFRIFDLRILEVNCSSRENTIKLFQLLSEISLNSKDNEGLNLNILNIYYDIRLIPRRRTNVDYLDKVEMLYESMSSETEKDTLIIPKCKNLEFLVIDNCFSLHYLFNLGLNSKIFSILLNDTLIEQLIFDTKSFPNCIETVLNNNNNNSNKNKRQFDKCFVNYVYFDSSTNYTNVFICDPKNICAKYVHSRFKYTVACNAPVIANVSDDNDDDDDDDKEKEKEKNEEKENKEEKERKEEEKWHVLKFSTVSGSDAPDRLKSLDLQTEAPNATKKNSKKTQDKKKSGHNKNETLKGNDDDGDGDGDGTSINSVGGSDDSSTSKIPTIPVCYIFDDEFKFESETKTAAKTLMWQTTDESLLSNLFDENLFLIKNELYFENGTNKYKMDKYNKFCLKYKHWKDNLGINIISNGIENYLNNGYLNSKSNIDQFKNLSISLSPLHRPIGLDGNQFLLDHDDIDFDIDFDFDYRRVGRITPPRHWPTTTTTARPHVYQSLPLDGHNINYNNINILARGNHIPSPSMSIVDSLELMGM